MRYPKFFLAAAVGMAPGYAQSPPSSVVIITAKEQNSRLLPPYLVYRHFLAWVNELDKQATAGGATDPTNSPNPSALRAFSTPT